MYIPSHFHEARHEHMVRLIKDYPLGMLVTHGDQGLDANHVPFEWIGSNDATASLQAHLALANPVLATVPEGSPVMVVFRGPQAYVSPNWYPSKAEAHRQVPTWNYQVVHVHGTLHYRHDEAFLRGVLARLTREHEQRTHPDRAWKMSDAPADYIQDLLKAIVGIDIRITRIDAKSKLSQNKDAKDREGAAAALNDIGETDLAAAMRTWHQD